MQGFQKYLTMAPVVATLTLSFIAVVLILLNYFFPGLQYGTYFKPLP
nr:photosystem I reaction center subunit IX [Chroococcidiopsis sp. CCMEE 010]